MKHFLCLLICVGSTVATVTSVKADQVPVEVYNKLQQREQCLSPVEFDWQLTQKEIVHSRPPSDVAILEKGAKKYAANEMKRKGVTDEKTIQNQVNGALTDVRRITQGSSRTSVDAWRFQRNNAETLVAGAHYQQYYADTAGLVAISNIQTDRPHRQTESTSVWRSPGESIRYRTPFQNSLKLSPEHLASLMALNPLKIYGAKWDLVSTTPNTWVVKTLVSDFADGPYEVTLTLDREHDAIPIRILFEERAHSVKFDLSDFQQYQGEWIAKHVKCTDNFLDIQTIDQDWVLQDVKPSKPFNLTLSNKDAEVSDYRLLSDHLTQGDLIFGVKNGDGNKHNHVVFYRWEGRFPSLETLKSIEAKEFPGESSPDPAKSTSALPFIGGLMCLVGGVWMFKRRGLS